MAAKSTGLGLVAFGGLIVLVGLINGILFGEEGLVYRRRWEIVLTGGAVVSFGLHMIVV